MRPNKRKKNLESKNKKKNLFYYATILQAIFEKQTNYYYSFGLYVFFKTEFFSSFFCSLYYHPNDNDNDETMKFDACIELIIALIENRLAVLEQILFFVCVHIVCVCVLYPKLIFILSFYIRM